jgi:hypothetical protein
MPIGLSGSILGSLALSVTVLPSQPYRVLGTFASAPRTCAVLQAAYTAAINRKAPAYPNDVRAADRTLRLGETVPEYRAKMGVTAQEYEELIEQQATYNTPGFRPNCDWKGLAGPSEDDEGHATYVTFTSPIFSENGRIAVVETSFREAGRYGYGLICTVRSKRGTWVAQCLRSWIT